VAVVTGGNRGIGRCVALALARDGWDVCISFRANEREAARVVDEVRRAGRAALAVQADVARLADVQRLVAQAQTLGCVGALVNNAGVIGEPRSILDVQPEHLEGVFHTNVLGSFYCTGAVAGVMSRQRGGRGGVIVNMSSAAARHGGMPNEAHYAASKGAIDSFTLALAKELAPHGIRVNAVRPGLIATDIHDAHGGAEAVERLGATVPLGRAGTPEEVADVVRYLCSPASAYVHGALIDVAGGR
jgi:NAD(P)-dependent dehydrogenase (short-subunit alcohol dehydrogenase family)